MEYTPKINLRMIAYCNDKGYKTLDERWETDKGNHHFVDWMKVQTNLFLTDQGISFKTDPNWGDTEKKIYLHRHSNEFDLWLKTKYPHKD